MTDYLGHDAPRAQITNAFSSGRLHHAWLLAGPQGLGKAHFAQQAAGLILTREPDPSQSSGSVPFDADPDHPAFRYWQQGTHPDLIRIEPEPRDDKERRKQEEGKPFDRKRNIAVDQIRGIGRKLTMPPNFGGARVIIIEPAEAMERGAANALLKMLEEPPARTHFLLISHNPGALLPTIRSRCQLLRFAPLSDAEMEQALTSALPDSSPDQRVALIASAQGAPGQALAFAGTALADVHSLIERIIASGDRDHDQRMRLANIVNGRANRDTYLALLRYAPSFAARAIRTLPTDGLDLALAAWEELNSLCARAVLHNLDAGATALRIGALLAAVAEPMEPGKRPA